jgi:flavin-dependent dehydrogenase
VFDVLIAGGGPGGAAAALVLARAGRQVLLLDATPPDPARLKVGESLPPAARPLLRDLGLLDGLEAEGHLRSSGTSSAWGSSQAVATDFVFDPNGSGWHLDRPRFDRLLRLAAGAAGAEVREGVAVRVSARSDGGWRLDLGEGEEVSARTLVDATGRRASVARALGARRVRCDRLVGLVGTCSARAGDLDARTLVEAVPEGWWYTALVPGERRVVAFMTDADLVPVGPRTPAGFRALLARTEHVAPLVGEAAIEPQTEAAHGSRLEPATGDGWLAVGDAALAFDPLSSQGIMTALYTGMVGAQALDALLDGDGAALESYGERLTAIAASYQRNLLQAYAGESRWPEHPFWARRRNAQVSLSGSAMGLDSAS